MLASIGFFQMKNQCTAEIDGRWGYSTVCRGQPLTMLPAPVVCLCKSSYVLCFLCHKEPTKFQKWEMCVWVYLRIEQNQINLASHTFHDLGRQSQQLLPSSCSSSTCHPEAWEGIIRHVPDSCWITKQLCRWLSSMNKLSSVAAFKGKKLSYRAAQ